MLGLRLDPRVDPRVDPREIIFLLLPPGDVSKVTRLWASLPTVKAAIFAALSDGLGSQSMLGLCLDPRVDPREIIFLLLPPRWL